jgi:hypothetical protein
MVALLKSVRYDETVTLVLQKRNMRSIYIYICSSPIIIRMAGGFKKMDAFIST